MSKKLTMKEMAYEFRCALASNFSVAESLLRKHPELIDHPVFGDSETALHFYATENQLDIVVWLIAHGAKPNGIAGYDFPLHVASLLGYRDVCRVLLDAGANPNLGDSVGETALHKAASGGHLEIIQLLLASGADSSIVEMCGELPVERALPRKLDQIKAIFDKYGDLNSTDTEQGDG